ncbi:putative pectate lyase 4 [Panicum miliaceum]|uniref:Pectate lyase 4 n=1 Tax=Panicum miliaceum TaxID=4540 RepID=A0A3L6T0J4_PANMI|nr:putative pectate lyase 4 [Panicum miliaceum]
MPLRPAPTRQCSSEPTTPRTRHVGDRFIKVTVHHCFSDGTRRRHPRLHFGKVHLGNNYTRSWGPPKKMVLC